LSRRGREPYRGLVTRPWIGIGFAGGLGAYRIEHYVAAELQQIAVPVNDDRLKPTLQHVTDPAVAAVEGLRVDPVELAHSLRQIRLGCFHHQVKVVVHQAVGMQAKMKADDDVLQHHEKAPAVFVIQEDVLPGVAPGGDVVEGAVIFDAKRRAIGCTLTQWNAQNKI
jgi:hypothetical protein